MSDREYVLPKDCKPLSDVERMMIAMEKENCNRPVIGLKKDGDVLTWSSKS